MSEVKAHGFERNATAPTDADGWLEHAVHDAWPVGKTVKSQSESIRRSAGASTSVESDQSSAGARAGSQSKRHGTVTVPASDRHVSTRAAKVCDRQYGNTEVGRESSANPKHPQEWTVAYYLGATKPALEAGATPEGPPRVVPWGSAEKAEKLKAMAAETRGTAVTLLVDSVREKNPAKPEEVGFGKPSHDPDDYVVDHFRIRDGQITQLASTDSKGLTQDVSDELATAVKNDPSKKLALIINADGGGNRGIMGDSSPIGSVEALKAAILRGTGGRKLEIADFDACEMSQTGALAALKDVAKDIVVSEETERTAVGRVDGQSLPDGLRHILTTPGLTGKQWGDAIVDDARRGVNDGPRAAGETPSKFNTGTATLANIDTSKLAELSSAVDKMGSELKRAMANPSSKREIDDIVSSLPRFGQDGSSIESYGDEKRDLKLFSENLQKAIADGKIADPTGSLAQSIARVQEAQKQAVTSFHGDQASGYDKDGGVSVYLPSSEFRDVQATLAMQTPVGKAVEILKHFEQLPAPMDGLGQDRDLSMVAQSACDFARGILSDLTDDQKRQVQPLMSVLDKLEQAKSAGERKLALTEARKAAEGLMSSPLQQELIAARDRVEADRKQQEKTAPELAADLPGWRSFVESLDWRA